MIALFHHEEFDAVLMMDIQKHWCLVKFLFQPQQNISLKDEPTSNSHILNLVMSHS